MPVKQEDFPDIHETVTLDGVPFCVKISGDYEYDQCVVSVRLMRGTQILGPYEFYDGKLEVSEDIAQENPSWLPALQQLVLDRIRQEWPLDF